jgi:hypothetical protein
MIAMGTTSYENFVSHNGLFPVGSSFLDRNLSLNPKPIQVAEIATATGTPQRGL